MQTISKPIKRSKLRQVLGKECYILKRKYHWLFSAKKWAHSKEILSNNYTVFKHQSLVLRPLKDVDMYLQENKRENLKIALAHINEIVIKPNETFSIWKLVGRPTKRKGYLEGLVLKQGKMAKDTGGGLCQMGNLLFWIFAHSPLEITERYRHGFDVFPDVKRKVPFGAGATLAYNHIDLQVKNTTNHTFKLKLWLDTTHLNGELFSDAKIKATYRIEERNHNIQQQFWGGYTRHNQIVQIKETANEVSEKLLVTNNAIMMYNPFLES
jgi:vancomycin resistance protein VanW